MIASLYSALFFVICVVISLNFQEESEINICVLCYNLNWKLYKPLF